MSNKHIAFIGAPSTDTKIMQMKSIDLLEGKERNKISSNIASKIIQSMDIKYVDYFSESEELDLSAAFFRRVEMLSIDPSYHIVSDEWVLNELANTMVRMNNLQDKIQKNAQMLGPDGKPIMTADHGQFIVVQAAFQVLLNQVAMEQEFWDFLYYVPISATDADILDEDGIAPKDKLHQKEVDIAINTLIGQLRLDVVKLPSVTEDAFKFLEAESEKWAK